MPVASGTLAGVNTWTFSGVVTDSQIQTAWSALITNGIYVINRAIYLDNTCDLTGVTGGFLVDFGTQVSPAIILHNSRDKTKSVFNNFTFLQRTGLIVSARSSFIQTTNGTTLANAGSSLSIDGLAQSGGGFVYGVVGNSGVGDSRFLNEMAYASQEGTTIYTQEFTEQELQPCVGASTQLKGITYEKAYGFPQIGTPTGNVNVVVYRSKQNTQSTANGGLIPIRLFPSGNRYAAVCYVDSYITRNNADINTRLIDTFGSNASNIANIMILNNYTRESWFGASKTNIPVTTWGASNTIFGGVLKKLQFINGDGGIVRSYDSRSTTVAQKCSFQETGTIDFLNASLAPTTDAQGRISLVHIGAIATGAGAPITRYTGQIYTFQKFGFRVIVGTPTMTSGDNDLSAFTPISLTAQAGITRTQAAITAATTINNFQELLEELHVLAIGLSGSQSYSGAFNGNLFNYDGSTLTTSFTTVNVDATAASKIAYNSATNTLTIKSSILMDALDVTRWNNVIGAINLLNGAAIQGIYQTSSGTSTIWEFGNTESPIAVGTSLVIYDASGTTKYFNQVTTDGVYRYYIAPQAFGEPYTYAIEKYGTRREEGTFPSNFGDIIGYAPRYSEDVGITETNRTTVAAYTILSDTAEIYDATANLRLSETGIKLGQLVARDGTFLDFGNFNVKIKDDAAAIVGVASGTITYKALVVNESTKYNAMKATPPKTITPNDTEQINVLIEDANGDSQVAILGGDNESYEIWKVPTTTATDDYATGTLLATLPNNTTPFRFIGISGFDLVGRDTSSGVRRRSSMLKGSYTQAFYVGNQIQLATDAPQLLENNLKLDELILKVDTNLDVAVSTRLADADYIDPATAQDVWEYTTRTLTSAGAAGATLEEIEGSTILAKKAQIDAVETKVDALPTLSEIEATTVLFKAADYVAPDNTKIAEIKTKVDTLSNYDDATTQTKLDSIQSTVDNINVDFTPVLDAIDTKPTLAQIEASTIAKTSDVTDAKTSIENKIDNIVIDNIAIADEVWNKEPERLKQVSTVQTTGDQLSSFNHS